MSDWYKLESEEAILSDIMLVSWFYCSNTKRLFVFFKNWIFFRGFFLSFFNLIFNFDIDSIIDFSSLSSTNLSFTRFKYFLLLSSEARSRTYTAEKSISWPVLTQTAELSSKGSTLWSFNCDVKFSTCFWCICLWLIVVPLCLEAVCNLSFFLLNRTHFCMNMRC